MNILLTATPPPGWRPYCVTSPVCPSPSPAQDHLVSVLGVASTVAHELGHNLGMSHDTAERRCSCRNEPRLGGCIMEPSTGYVASEYACLEVLSLRLLTS